MTHTEQPRAERFHLVLNYTSDLLKIKIWASGLEIGIQKVWERAQEYAALFVCLFVLKVPRWFPEAEEFEKVCCMWPGSRWAREKLLRPGQVGFLYLGFS